jgi:hypothetical protein
MLCLRLRNDATKNFTRASFKAFLKLEIGIAFNHYQFVECIITQATAVRAKYFPAILKSTLKKSE